MMLNDYHQQEFNKNFTRNKFNNTQTYDITKKYDAKLLLSTRFNKIYCPNLL